MKNTMNTYEFHNEFNRVNNAYFSYPFLGHDYALETTVELGKDMPRYINDTSGFHRLR